MASHAFSPSREMRGRDAGVQSRTRELFMSRRDALPEASVAEGDLGLSSGSCAKGCMVAAALSVPFWVLVGIAAYLA